MATAFFFCGFAASGKSTLARFLESALPAHRYSVDEYLLASGHRSVFDDEYGHAARGARESFWTEGRLVLDAGGT